jgi:hypothetical protein
VTVGRNVQFIPPFGMSMPGAAVQGGGGAGPGAAQVLTFRDPVDAARAQFGPRTPQAEYPDGYLGTINSRREDRLLNSLKKKLNDRAYQRGVHKGERIDPHDYYWPAEFGPDSGLARQAAAVVDRSEGAQVFRVERPAPIGTVSDRLTILGERMPRGSEGIELDPRALANLDRLRPAWA